MNYVVVENIWGIAGRVIESFISLDEANQFILMSFNDCNIVELTNEELDEAIENEGYIEF